VEVGFCAVKNRAVSNRNCVAVRRGGEQRNENDQSVTQTAQAGGRGELDSVGVDGRAFERVAKPVGAGVNPLAAGRSPVVAPMVGDGMAGSPSVIIRETRQCWRVRRADRPRVWLAGVRASVVALKRVMTVERRDAGRWQCAGPKDGKKNQRECPRGLASGGVRQVPLAWWIPNV
jgi:hypothetical protein